MGAVADNFADAICKQQVAQASPPDEERETAQGGAGRYAHTRECDGAIMPARGVYDYINYVIRSCPFVLTA
jgi:hypothetical protein